MFESKLRDIKKEEEEECQQKLIRMKHTYDDILKKEKTDCLTELTANYDNQLATKCEEHTTQLQAHYVNLLHEETTKYSNTCEQRTKQLEKDIAGMRSTWSQPTPLQMSLQASLTELQSKLEKSEGELTASSETNKTIQEQLSRLTAENTRLQQNPKDEDMSQNENAPTSTSQSSKKMVQRPPKTNGNNTSTSSQRLGYENTIKQMDSEIKQLKSQLQTYNATRSKQSKQTKKDYSTKQNAQQNGTQEHTRDKEERHNNTLALLQAELERIKSELETKTEEASKLDIQYNEVSRYKQDHDENTTKFENTIEQLQQQIEVLQAQNAMKRSSSSRNSSRHKPLLHEIERERSPRRLSPKRDNRPRGRPQTIRDSTQLLALED